LAWSRRALLIAPPYEEGATWSAWVSRGFDPWTREGGAGNTWVLVDQFSGEVVYDGSPEDGNVFDQAWDDWSFPLHTGDFLGTATRVAWVFIGLSPLVLGATGITMNLVRRSKRAKAAARAATATTDLPPPTITVEEPDDAAVRSPV